MQWKLGLKDIACQIRVTSVNYQPSVCIGLIASEVSNALIILFFFFGFDLHLYFIRL